MRDTANIEIIVDQSKENRRYRIRGIFILFLATLFATVAFFVTVGISVSTLCKNVETAEEKANGSSDEYQDIRYTMIDGVMKKEYLSEEEIAKEDQRIEEEKKRAEEEQCKKEEEEKRKKEEQKKIAYVPPVGPKTVYLTFDDGPGPDTGRLLDVLKKYNVKATFFVTCGRAGNRDMIKRAYNEGHSIGLHSCSHNYSKIYVSEDAFFNDLNEVSNLVKDLTGHESKLIRFPGGSSNTVSATYNKGIMSRLTKAVQERGYAYFDWNVSSGDAGNANNSGMVYNNIIGGLRGDYSIVLQHDIKGFSVDAVEGVIKFGQQYGFTFKALDENSPTAHHRINN